MKSVEEKCRIFLWHRDKAGENTKLFVARDWEWIEECNKREAMGNKGE